MKKFIIPAFICSAILLFSSCKKFAEGEGNDEELITTMKLNFTPVGGGTTQTFTFEDIDGAGGNTPVIDNISLAAGTTYNVSVELWNNAATPPENTTLEVETENEAHRFYYTPSAGSTISVSNLNNDDNGVPLGITSTWTVGTASSGTINVTLRHYPGTPPDKQISDPINSPKSGTDITVDFNYTIL
ncbi:MAG: hypothetical protein QM687_07545 [Ferruginibacter sp.]